MLAYGIAWLILTAGLVRRVNLRSDLHDERLWFTLQIRLRYKSEECAVMCMWKEDGKCAWYFGKQGSFGSLWGGRQSDASLNRAMICSFRCSIALADVNMLERTWQPDATPPTHHKLCRQHYQSACMIASRLRTISCVLCRRSRRSMLTCKAFNSVCSGSL